ncbi:class I SAM-dependent methyltransferase [Candidatus Woesearchaeota archaeon]|nr:class I SAM-dependent methyltransferase [Candidatus Woesearchaeota archaeon]
MNYYDETAEGYEELHKKEQLNKIKIILENLKIEKTDKLLDIGCGMGFLFDFAECDFIGIDPSKKLIEKSRHKDKILLGNAEKLPFKDNEFDVIVSITAIHNFDNIEQSLKEMKRVLRDKGKIAITVLKKSKKSNDIEKLLNKYFKINTVIDEGMDLVYFGEK